MSLPNAQCHQLPGPILPSMHTVNNAPLTSLLIILVPDQRFQSRQNSQLDDGQVVHLGYFWFLHSNRQIPSLPENIPIFNRVEILERIIDLIGPSHRLHKQCLLLLQEIKSWIFIQIDHQLAVLQAIAHYGICQFGMQAGSYTVLVGPLDDIGREVPEYVVSVG